MGLMGLYGLICPIYSRFHPRNNMMRHTRTTMHNGWEIVYCMKILSDFETKYVLILIYRAHQFKNE